MSSSVEQDGLVDQLWWRRRQDDYLEAATHELVPTSMLSAIAHLERSRRDARYDGDLDALDDRTLAVWFHRIDDWLDCADFDVLRLLTLWFAYRDLLPSRVTEAIRARVLAFKYWYTDGTPDHTVDHRWYWSENHRLIFHTIEYLSGQAFPDDRFAVAGLTGGDHMDRSSTLLDAWFDEKARSGFSEWHSDAYYGKDLAPLVTLAEFAEDGALADRAATFADLLLVDLALHSRLDNAGSTHGRSYMRLRATASEQPVFGVLKLCFDRTVAPWPTDENDPAELLPRTEGVTLLARCARYRPPDIARRIAGHPGPMVDREAMSLHIDPSEPLVDHPMRADGISYTDPEMLPFWWDRGALTPWQLVPLTLGALDRHRLWDADLFRPFREVRDAFGDDPAVMQQLAADLHPLVNAGLLSRVDTYTWRNSHTMLSTAQSYRPGCAGHQHHICQATLDERAVVFTNHPGNPPSLAAGDYRDEDRYWTGSATLPRAVQHGRAVIQIYAPGFESPEMGALAPFSYEDHTHAWFPVEHFDEWFGSGSWVFGRRGGGYVALWSWRVPVWRHHDPASVHTFGLTDRFDLAAPGGPDNVWIMEVGDRAQWGDLQHFAQATHNADVVVEKHGWGSDGAHLGFAVRYRSPAEGLLELDWTGPLQVDGREVPVGGHPRFDNPFVTAAVGETTLRLHDTHGTFVLDLAAGTRGS